MRWRFIGHIIWMPLVFVACRTTQPKTSDAHRAPDFETLRAFVEADPMAFTPDSTVPEVREAPDELREYVVKQYENDPRVRCLLAKYYLRYDALLLEHGLITIGASNQCLFMVMHDQEGRFHSYPGENISAMELREHIGKYREWFAADAVLDAQLAANRNAFEQLSRSWEEDRQRIAASNPSKEEPR